MNGSARHAGRPPAAASCLAACALLIGAAVAGAAPRPVSFATEDGVTIAATLYEASSRPAPAVVLLHMLGRSRDDWRAVADRLAGAGIHALAIDFRGHGGSTLGTPAEGGGPDLARMALDVRAAVGFLASRPDLVDRSRIGIGGASLGANVAIAAAAADETIRSVALLSPSLDYRSLRADAPMRKYGARPALLAAATDDPYAMRSVHALAGLGGGTREIRTSETAGHGTRMLEHDGDLARALVDWFLRTLI
ncbi:MAG: alpha/beta fold hydrolase [Acidobacteria bacterium]|nr:alpha/beta fold hydrolase [Acidobacteriota bacterium]